MLKKLVPIFTFVIVVIILLIIYFRDTIKEQKIDYILDKSLLTLESQLKNEKINSLNIAISLSKNEALINALENDDEDLGYEILSDIMNTIKENTNIVIRTQIITTDYNIFSRSWDNTYAGMPLQEYRTDLKYFQTHKTPRTSIEVGRMLSIKTTVPVYKDETLLGFVEIISFFDSITDFFKNMGIDLYVLMDDKYFDISVFMQENVTVDKYILSNRNYNHNNIKMLNNIDFKKLKINRILHRGDKYIFYENMKNGDGESIGMFLFVLDKEYLEYFKEPKDDVSFLINMTRNNLYDIIKEHNYEDALNDNIEIKSLLSLRDIISKEDKKKYLEIVQKKLDKYSKDELIQIILEQKIIKKVDGKIR
ncbi:hypothetical protein HUE87_01020 [Candidatus Sulfurimonas marisnigri]|uniref:Double Cache domain-containing protein n=1 Tax=Candidatus Sulfurimonas marisnigri TaxID=2740405 RepID=A0A7S7M1M5_9BACT|nr:cache domain-containing protein [Candidatus Sulfurimonas marisnigri]QOY54858.1 hypothetical protein HUE87_01020 [Candidatus Sulfurimonas marisnigri]